MLVDSFKKIKPSVVTILGGGLVTSDPKLVLDAIMPSVCVVGEGDLTVVELAGAIENGNDFLDINGVVYYDNSGRFVCTPSRAAIDDLDSLPYPDFEGFGIDRYMQLLRPSDNQFMNIIDEPRYVPIMSSRSCPYRCTFCSQNIGRK
jgi:radical SAM superfamily enzyme YgiQ (UPF0313 family)